MNQITKFVIGSLAGAALAIAIVESASAAPEPNDAIMTYKAGEYPDLDWFIAKWEAQGFQMPKDGEKFKWADYMEIVEGDAQEFDLVIYTENGKDKGALVEENDKGESDHKPGVLAFAPASPGLVLIIFVNKEQIKTLLRPKVKQASGTHV